MPIISLRRSGRNKYALTRDDGIVFNFTRDQIQNSITSRQRTNFLIAFDFIDDDGVTQEGRDEATRILQEIDNLNGSREYLSVPMFNSVEPAELEMEIEEFIRRSGWLNEPEILSRILVCYASIPSTEPLWIILLAPPSTGKTWLVTRLEIPEIAYRITSLTQNAFSPGGRNEEDIESTFALLDVLSGKCFIIDDLTPILGQDPRVRTKILGEITAMYGQTYIRASPGGLRRHNGSWNWIFGLTPELLYQHNKAMSTFGQRFLIQYFADNDEFETPDDVLSENEFKSNLLKIVMESRERVNRIIVDDESKEYIRNTMKQFAVLRSYNLKRDHEGPQRLEKQCLSFSKMRAAIYKHRSVNIEDVKEFIELLYETIPSFDIIKECTGRSKKDINIALPYLSEKMIANVLKRAVRRGVVVEGTGENKDKYYINPRFTVLDPVPVPSILRDADETIHSMLGYDENETQENWFEADNDD